MRRVHAALGALFPEAPDPPSGPADAARSGQQLTLYIAVQVAAVFTGVIVLLPRIAGISSWGSLYAEDRGVFLVDALAHPWHLFVPYGGYEELMPRLVGQVISFLPLTDAAVAFAVAGAGIAALCALFIYHALSGWIRSPWLRALVGAAFILLPLAPIEIADCAVGAPWYVLAALFFGLLWRPKGWIGMTAAALIAFAATSSEILTFVYAPLVLLRLIALPRWREQAVTAGWLAGLLVQVPIVLQSYAQHTQRLGGLAKPIQALGFYFHNVALRAFGWKVSLRLVDLAGLNGATVIACLLLAAGFCWAVITGTRQSRIFIAAALSMGFLQAVVAATLVPLVIRQHYQYNFEGGSRYATMPIIAMTAAAVAALDTYLFRQARVEGSTRIALLRRSPQALAAVTALACVLVLGWLPDYRFITERHFWGYWPPKATRMLTDCEQSSSGDIKVWTWGNTKVTVSCSRLRR